MTDSRMAARGRIAVLALLALTAVPARAQQAPEGDAAVVTLPRDVAVFLRRRAGCNHLVGDGVDPEQVATTVRSRFWMKCNTLEDDERRLRARYAHTQAVMDSLDGADEGE